MKIKAILFRKSAEKRDGIYFKEWEKNQNAFLQK